MNPQLEAAWQVHEFLTAQNLRYVVIGGIALQKWGEPRFTRDVDITVESSVSDPPRLVRLITEQFGSRTQDPVAFARRTRMILIKAGADIDVDISLALPGYEDHVFLRSVDFEIEPGKSIRLCSAEDLVIHKAVAGRPQDMADIQGVVQRQGEGLDATYVRDWLKAFADALDNPELPDRFENAWRER
ncbi:MAG: nucleotidyl transferase AbiEii/AbiGii toxin family protein [Chloroflexi bacterium]|nr:nucleotidyl transferase AbiEii/AbiGii toxin family protein [Chloroflexota bacterium]